MEWKGLGSKVTVTFTKASYQVWYGSSLDGVKHTNVSETWSVFKEIVEK